jgi:hypothetical protein
MIELCIAALIGICPVQHPHPTDKVPDHQQLPERYYEPRFPGKKIICNQVSKIEIVDQKNNLSQKVWEELKCPLG